MAVTGNCEASQSAGHNHEQDAGQFAPPSVSPPSEPDSRSGATCSYEILSSSRMRLMARRTCRSSSYHHARRPAR